MLTTILKALGTAAVAILIAYIGKRFTALAAAIAALPLMSMMVVGYMALDEKDVGIAKANLFVSNFFYLFWPGLLFFIVLPVGQRIGIPFWWSFGLAVGITFGATWGAIVVLNAMGVKLE